MALGGQGALAAQRPQLLARRRSSRGCATAPSRATSSGGCQIPLAGYEQKRIYVWFENVIGYLSAAKEWAQLRGEPEAWRDFWQDPACKSYYFIGKDNIWFHTLSWPAMLMAYGGLNLPYDVPANQYLNFGGGKASTSRGTAPFLPDYLARYDPDTLRYYLAAVMPETADSDFSEDDLIRRNNDELVATWGNLAHRVLTFTYRRFDGRIPQPGELDAESRALLEQRGGRAGRRRREHRPLPLPRRAVGGDGLRPGDEPLSRRQGALEGDPRRPAVGRDVAVHGAGRDQRPEGRALPVPAVHQRAGCTAISASTATSRRGGWRVVVPPAGQSLREPEALFKKLEPLTVDEA